VTENQPAQDFGQSHPWPAELADHLDQFRQGHIVDDVPVFFGNLGAAEIWKTPRLTTSPEERGIAVELDGTLHRAMLLTQGCDIVRKNTPWVTVAPVYDTTTRLDKGQQGNARARKVWHLVPLTADWASDRLWVADLRLELAIEKSALLSREPIEAFASEADYAQLSEQLGLRRKRPDLPNDVLKHVVGPLFEAVKVRPEEGAPLMAGVRELRVQLDDPLIATRVVVFVVSDSPDGIDEAGWQGVLNDIYAGANSNGLIVVGPEVTSLDDMTAAEYLTTHRIEDDESS
jgi:hypothetical protein